MKKSILGVAVTAALFGGAAHATPLPAFNAGNTAEIFVSGASASAPFIKSVLQNTAVCSDMWGFYLGTTTVGSENSVAYLCKINNTGTLGTLETASGSRVQATYALIHKVNNGGSIQGVAPVATQTPLITGAFLAVNNTGALGTCAQVGATNDYNGCNLRANTVAPTVGISDVDPAQFTGQNNPGPLTDAALTAAIGNFGTSSAPGVGGIRPAFAQIFGVTVTRNLYKALQVAQFPGDKSCNPTGASYAATTAPAFAAGHGKHTFGDSQGCMPSLTSGQIASIMTGKIADWTQLYVGTAASAAKDGHVIGATSLYNLISGSTNPIISALAPAVGSEDVHVCTRANGSGSLATMGIKRLNYTCATSATPPAMSSIPNSPLPLIPAAGTPGIHQMSSAGNVSNCLNYLDRVAGTNPFGASTLPAGDFRWAIGYNSTDNNANLVNSYQYIKIDGVAPTQQNEANGSYHDWAETTVQTLPVAAGGDSNSIITKDFLASLSASAIGTANNNGLGCPAIAGTFANGMVGTVAPIGLVTGHGDLGIANHCWGQSGFMASGSTTAAQVQGLLVSVAQEYYSTAPVNPLSHDTQGGTSVPNNCRAPAIFNGTSPRGLQLK